MEYLVIFLSLFLYFLQTYGSFIFVPLIYLVFYFAIRWAGVKTKTLCLGLTILSVPILLWSLLLRSIFSVEDASELWRRIVDILDDAFTFSSMTGVGVYTWLSMVVGAILCAAGIAKKRRQERFQAAA
ncbi:hypothetical protein DBV14_19325 [Variovorax sp. KBW07]|uniref:hypothetical protein n=1 Tax=Variovorax sp. KBW07 TaxID=2153358 RepID=UPI000F585A30|nr:hypothetical protein [Variovorax sp. KBW07]RQO48812.1 hypothetical protein DBV14_19325 [Variovorax sp. KBW07]